MLENKEELTDSKNVMDLFSRCFSAFMLRVLDGFTSSKRSQKGVKDKKKISLTLRDWE